MFQKELTLIKQVHQKNVWFVIIGTLKMLYLINVCNKCHFALITAYELKNIAIFNVKVVDFRCIWSGISRDEVVNRLNNSMLEDKEVLQMDFGANKTPAKVIRKGEFGETYFGGIYSGITGKKHKKSQKELDIVQKYYCTSCYVVSVIKYDIKCGTSLRFWENKGWID